MRPKPDIEYDLDDNHRPGLVTRWGIIICVTILYGFTTYHIIAGFFA